MTELEKLQAGLPYDVNDPEVNARKLSAATGCARLEAIPVTDAAAKDAAIRDLFGKIGRAHV